MKSWSRPDRGWQIRAEQAIAHGSLTNSKRPACLVNLIYPTHLSRAKGCYVWDTEGRQYIDFITGLGSSILGHAHEEVAEAMVGQLRNGTSFSLGSDLEVTVAEKVKELFPCIDLLRFLKTGSDACSAAIRIARAYHRVSSDSEGAYRASGRATFGAEDDTWLPTKSDYSPRVLVLSDGYHGHDDLFVGLAKPHLGVVRDPYVRPLTGNESLIPIAAAVIVEPIVTDMSKERIEYLKKLRELCSGHGTLLIFDEIITGFRWPQFSFSNQSGIRPDLICLGKAIANGMPLSVVGGRRDVMNCGEWFISSTFAGETVSLAAAYRTMKLLQTKYSIDHLWSKGEHFVRSFNSIWQNIQIEGYPTRGVFRGGEHDLALFWQECVKAGVMFGPSFFFNFSHIEVSDSVLSVCSDVIGKIKTKSVRLMGEMPKKPFAQRMRDEQRRDLQKSH